MTKRDFFADRAAEAERLADHCAFGKDRDRLLSQAQAWRQKDAAQAEITPSMQAPTAQSWLARVLKR